MQKQCTALVMVVVSIVGTGAAAASVPYDVDVVDGGLPEALAAGSTATVHLKVRNAGSRPWVDVEGFALAYHWLTENGERVVWDGVRTHFEQIVEPDDEIQMAAKVVVPTTTGLYHLQWDVVQEGVTWLSKQDPTPVAPIPVRLVLGHAFTLVEGRVPWRGWSDSHHTSRLRIRNDGIETWRADGSFSVAAHWLAVDGTVVSWEGVRTSLPEDVAPGGQVSVDAVLRMPDQTGRWLLQWDMVEEGVCWFSERDPGNQPVFVVVTTAGPWLPLAAPLVTVVLLILTGFGVFFGGRRLVAVAAAADLLWLVAVLFLKQWVVLAEAGEWPGPSAVPLALCGAAVMALLLVLVTPRWRPWVVLAAAAGATFVVQADLVYQRFFGDIPSVVVLRVANQASQVRESIAALFTAGDLLLWLDVILALPLVMMVARCTRRRPGRPGAMVGTLAVLAAVALHVASGPAAPTVHSLSQVFRNLYLARDIGVLNFHVVDLALHGRQALLPAEIGDKDFVEVVDYFAATAPQRSGQGPFFAAAAGADLLMIQVESLQSFVIGMRVGGEEITPNLNRWASEGFFLPRIADQTAHGRSSDAEILTQVSLLPIDSGAAVFAHPDNHFTGMAGVLAEHGYHTLSAVPFDGNFWNRRITHRSFGYQRSLFAEDFRPGDEVGWGLSDREFLLQMAEVLGSAQRPYAAWLITLSLHHPFAGFPHRHKSLDVGEWEGKPMGNFLHTMHFFDRALGEMEAELERLGLLDNLLVVVWGDHDAGFKWKPEAAAVMGVPADAIGWYSSQAVPLLIRAPEASGLIGVMDQPAGQVDVAPTVLGLLGFDSAPYPFLGRNLLGEIGNSTVVSEYGCWEDRDHIFLQGGDRLALGRCYDRRSLLRLETDECAVGWQEARRRVQVSGKVFRYDLQERVRRALEDRGAGR